MLRLKKKSGLSAELGIWVFCFLLLVLWLLRVPLINGESTFAHDNFFWNYPLFHFFAQSLINGQLPLWNPFTHGGEPFYSIWGAVRANEPTTVLGILFGSLFTKNTATLFNWIKFLQYFLMAVGMYTLLRPVARHLITRLSLIPILLMSSPLLCILRQDGIHSQFLWAPFILMQYLRIVVLRKNGLIDWLLLAILIGMNWQAYHFVGTWLMLLFVTAGFLFFARPTLKHLMRRRGIVVRFGLVGVVLALMTLPNVILLKESRKVVFPARMVEADYEAKTPIRGPLQYEGGPENVTAHALRMPYSVVEYSGTFSNITDIAQMVSPRGNRSFFYPNKRLWGLASEAMIYVGLLAWAVGLLGAFYGRHPLKKVALFSVGSTLLYMLGPGTIFHHLVYTIFPPAWFLRHGHLLVQYFCFGYLFFFVLGMNLLLKRFNQYGSIFKPGPLGLKLKEASVILLATVTISLGASLFLSGHNGFKLNWLLLIWIVGGIWAFQKGYKAMILAALLASQVFLILRWGHATDWQYAQLILFILVPILSLGYLAPFLQSKYGFTLERSRRIVYAVILLSVLTDVSYLFYRGIRLFANRAAFRLITSTHAHATEAQVPEFREMVRRPQLCIKSPDLLQVIRYPEFFYRAPTAFSPKYEGIDKCEKTGAAAPLSPTNAEMDFTNAHQEKRWNSFLLTKGYFSLIHSGISDGALYDIFLMNQLPIHFKKSSFHLNIAEAGSIQEQLGVAKFRKLLHSHFFINSERSDSIESLRTLKTEDSPFEYSVLEYNWNSLTLTVHSAKTGFVYWADGYDSGWNSSVNGVVATTLEANRNFKAVAIPAGDSTVRFYYTATPYLATISVYYFLAFLGFAIFLVKGLKISVRHWYRKA